MQRCAALLCLMLLTLALPSRAQTQIHRCIGANGGAVFTDQPCASLQATPIKPGTPEPGTPSLSTPPPTLCAASMDALRRSVIDAFAARNANRMAGLMLWDGYGRGSVIETIRSLNELMKQPLLDVDIPDNEATTPHASVATDQGDIGEDPFADRAPVPMPPPTPAGSELVLHTTGSDGSGSSLERRFSVVHRAGCLWLRSLD